MKTQDCSRHFTCNAALCPLDMSGYHRNGETICFYLLESGKAGATDRFQHDPVYKECLTALPRIRSADIQKRVAKATNTPTRTVPGWKRQSVISGKEGAAEGGL